MQHFSDLYENEQYYLSHREVLRSFKDGVTADGLIYLIKNIITRNDFQIENDEQMELLLFYYFVILGKVEFTNDYSFSVDTEKLPYKINLHFLLHHEDYNFKDLKQYFILGHNEVFLSKIFDTTSNKQEPIDISSVREVHTIIDFFLIFTHECSELYSFS